jgi:RimJ/RimL family protein N-acetyltransferase
MSPLLEPVLITDRLVLRPPREADLDDLIAGIGDLRVSRMLGRVPHPYKRSDADGFLAAVRRNAHSGRALNLSIVREGRLIGGMAIGSLPGYCEFGYWLAHDAWGKGYATEAGRAVLAYGFDGLGLSLIRSGVLWSNAASLRVQIKLGFRRIGISRRYALARKQTVDHIDTVLSRRRYEATAR